jgi:tripartite-type tricarboxylate transporter receptor subunit TctC
MKACPQYEVPASSRHRAVTRRAALAALCAIVALAASPGFAQAPDLPAVIRIVVPFATGGSNDIAARMIAKLMTARTGKSVIVENRPGASGFIGASAVARGPKDGSILLLSSSSMITAAATKNNPSVDILKELTPVSILSESPLLFIVNAESPIRTPADLIAAARAKPDTITNGTPGLGTIAHLTGELLNDQAKIQLRHIPYQGGGPAMIDLMAGRIDINIVSNSSTAAQVTQGKLRPVAITWIKPSPDFPGVPTMDSVVPGFEVGQWQAVWAPVGTPAAMVERLNRELNDIVRTPDFAVLLRDDGGIAQALTPAQADAKVRATFDQWRNLAKAKNLVAD